MKDKNIQNEGAETPVVQSQKVRLDWRGFPIVPNRWDDEDDGEEYILKRDGSYSRVRL